jgi:hypothetical protein
MHRKWWRRANRSTIEFLRVSLLLPFKCIFLINWLYVLMNWSIASLLLNQDSYHSCNIHFLRSSRLLLLCICLRIYHEKLFLLRFGNCCVSNTDRRQISRISSRPYRFICGKCLNHNKLPMIDHRLLRVFLHRPLLQGPLQLIEFHPRQREALEWRHLRSERKSLHLHSFGNCWAAFLLTVHRKWWRRANRSTIDHPGLSLLLPWKCIYLIN